MPSKIYTVVLFCLLLVSHAYAQDVGALLQQAGALLAKGQAAEAYQLLAPLEAEQKNDPRFDYLLGASLLESKQPEKAIVPLKRALALNPLFAAARLDLGRAHFAVGNFAEAKSAFITTAYQNPPPAALQAIDYYLAEIERRGATANLSGNAYVSATVGRDTNVPGGLKDKQLFYNGLPFDLDEKNLQSPDAYLAYAVGANARLALDYNLALFANADVQRRDNNTLHRFDSINGTVNLGLEKTLNQANIKISGNFGRGTLDYANLRRNNGGTLEWRYDFSRLDQLSLFAQIGRIRYIPEAYRNYDVNQRLFGMSWFTVSEAKGNPSLSFGLNYGEEIAQGPQIDGNKRTWGARLGGQMGVAGNLVAAAGLGFGRDQFDKENIIPYSTQPDVPPTSLSRRDRKLDMNLGLTWTPELNWSVRPNYTYTRATSNLPIYEFTRNDFSFSVRRDFR